MTILSIGNRPVGSGYPAFVIAEVAQAHDGSVGMAHSFIDGAADAGADAIKFQTHVAVSESTLDEPWRVAFSKQDKTRFEYWKRMEFTREQWAGLAEHAAKRNIIFLSSAFSLQAVEMLDALGMPAWKIASGEVASTPLFEAMLKSGRPFLVSTGMSPWAEVESIAATLRGRVPYAFFQCTTKYPTPLEDVGLNVIAEMRRRLGCPAGLSDHSGNAYVPMAAIAQGADLVEVHMTFDRRMFGPDTIASVTVAELEMICRMRDVFSKLAAHPVDKNEMAERLGATRKLFTKSIGLSRRLESGTILTEDVLTLKKPGTGIPATELPRVIGRKLKRAVEPERLLTMEDLS